LITGRLLNSYFPTVYNSTKDQQVIHNPLKLPGNAFFELWVSFFSFVGLRLNGAESYRVFFRERANKKFIDSLTVKGSLLLPANIFWLNFKNQT
jgi:hypothetical protein